MTRVISNVHCVFLTGTMNTLTCLTFISVAFYTTFATVSNINTEQINGIFIEFLVEKYGTDNHLSRSQFASLVRSLSDRQGGKGEPSLANITDIDVLGKHEHHCNSSALEDCTEYLTQHVSRNK